MKELQIPTRRVPVELHTVLAEHWRGFLFLTDDPYHSGGPEEIGGLLNDDRHFLPFLTHGPVQSAIVVNKTHITRVRVGLSGPLDADESPALDQSDHHVRRLRLADGTRIVGEVVVETPPSASRIVDKLNLSRRFLAVWTTDGLEFVHREHLVSVE